MVIKRMVASFALLCAAVTVPAQTVDEVHADFEKRYAEGRTPQAREALAMAQGQQEREALEFLYAYMDWADVVNMPPAFFVENTRLALQARAEMNWGSKVPQREWRHFVLPVRVNNEYPDSFRLCCYKELAARVKGLPMREAVLEVNHWCHERVTYRPSDARTSGPLASIRTATGRCGEESTFTVAALRTVGIPARQVYTPRWAHTDDNHAWVEAWVDGKWYFLGACEPAPDLNMAWFNQPASRGMLMNTTVLGRYKGDEQVLRQTADQTTINVTENYAPTARTTATVVDAAGKPVAGARVRFGLYNYGEFYSMYEAATDAAGSAMMVSGLGDMLIWAAKDGRYGFAKVHAGEEARVALTHTAGERLTVELDMVPPPVNANLPKATAEAEALNNRRLMEEDSIRMAYVHTWATAGQVKQVGQVLGYDVERLQPLFTKSEGNFMALFDLLARFKADTTVVIGGTVKPQKEFLLDMLETLTDKDLRDFNPDVLADHLTSMMAAGETRGAKMSAADYERFRSYVLCPRIGDEELSAWRSALLPYVDASKIADYRRNPQLLADWLKDRVKLLSGWGRYLCQLPEPTLRYGQADAFSLGLCYVALCRTLGIAARLNPVTVKFEYYLPDASKEEAACWTAVSFAPRQPAADAPAAERKLVTLKMAYEPRRFMENPCYYNHFTLSRLVDGMPSRQNYGEGDSWESRFREGTLVEPGDYALISGTRLANGSVLVTLDIFPVATDTTVTLKMREDKEQVQVIGSFNAENIYYDLKDKQEKSVLATTGRGYFVVALLKAADEPSTHILHDIEAQRESLEAWGREMLMLFPTQEEYDAFAKRLNEYPNLPANLRFGVDTQGQVAKDLFGSGLTQSEQRPVLIIGDTFNRVVFFSQGYTIGIGDQIKKTLGKL